MPVPIVFGPKVILWIVRLFGVRSVAVLALPLCRLVAALARLLWSWLRRCGTVVRGQHRAARCVRRHWHRGSLIRRHRGLR